ncbi:MAG TPA: glycosyltransferase [Burkholderiales bacterium]|nr:glycosyltransferase [Burkholderiales bacterium]
MEQGEVCVLHVAGDGVADSFDGTVRAVAQIGLHQMLIPLNASLPGRSAQRLEIRPMQWPSRLLARIRTLEDELAALACERSLYGLHLHGAMACLLGSRALRAIALKAGAPLKTRVLFSPHLANLSPWTGALVGRLLKAELTPLHSGVVIALPGEAHMLSRLLGRSAEILPPAVDPAFFQVSRAAGGPAVFAGGNGIEAVQGVSRLAVLLNGRQDRVPMAWLGPVSRPGRSQLEAAGIKVFDAEDDAGNARLLSGATAYLHLSQRGRQLGALAQAMAAGVPCLASDTLGHRALIRHGDTGFICAGDLDFMEKLIMLLRDAEERERIGQAARAEAGRAFTQRHFDTAVLRAYGFHRVTLLPMKSVHVA